jgi:hypothetical protein
VEAEVKEPLNKIPAERYAANIERCQRSIARQLAGENDPGLLWHEYFEIGAFRSQLGDRQATRAAFLEAIRYGLVAYHAIGEPTSESQRTPWDFGQLLGTVAAFGTREQQESAAAIPRFKWYWPEDPFYSPMAAAYAVLQSYLHGSIDVAAAHDLIATTSSGGEKRGAVEYHVQIGHALLALHEANATALSNAVSKIATEHQRMATGGDLKLSPEGLIGVLPLGLVRLGRALGLAADSASPYVPVTLL